jgi:hypothetical protein
MNWRNKIRVVLIVIAAVLVLVRLLNFDFNEFEWKEIMSPLSLILIIIAMVFSIRDSKKIKNNGSNA